ncbi:MAG: citrate/2-methylcitrate synthase [Clostridia bacterium]|nr:citrate/2-methylcitrate synthase [Clostridia bacterium]
MQQSFKEFSERVRANYKIAPEMYSRYNAKRGLRNADGTGVLVGLTNIGNVHGYIADEGDKIPDAGCLRYRGVDVASIIDSCVAEDRFGYEEAAFLLLCGGLPTKRELENFKKAIGQNRELPENFTEDMILKAPSRDIMNKLARSVLTLYSYDADPDTTSVDNLLRQAIELIARFPTIAAYAYQAKIHYFDKKSLVIHSPREDLSNAENFLYMIRQNNEYSKLEARVLDTALILHAEHGGGNNSAFTTRVVSSSGTDTYSAIAAAVCSLKGPRHGGANNKVMAMMSEIEENVKDWSNDTEVRNYLINILKKEAGDGSGLIYGMGHAIYTISDPRAVILKSMAEELAKEKGYMPEFYLYDAIERLTQGAFEEVRGKQKVMCANVDLYSGFVYKMLDIPKELYTPIFALSRIAGWCAHRIEETVVESKIIRPAYKSVTGKRDYQKIQDRIY